MKASIWVHERCTWVYVFHIFLVQEKVMQGTSRSADSRAYCRIAPKSLELVLVSRSVALAFCGRLRVQQPAEVEYFDPERDWPKLIVFHASFSVVMEEMAFLGDTRSRCELLVFAQANPARLPLTMGILQPNIPVRRASPSDWLKRSRSTSALLPEGRSPWPPQRRSACCMLLSGFAQSFLSSLWQPERVQR